MTYTDEELLARVEYASDLIDTLVTLAADMERYAVDEWDESDFIIQVADTLRALITYRERLEKAESALHDEVKRLRFERDALRAALVDHNDLLRSASQIAKREGIDGEIASTNWDAYYNRVAVVLKRHHEISNTARAALKGDDND